MILLCLLVSGCEIAFPIVLDGDAEEAETQDVEPDASPDSAREPDVRSDAKVWDQKIGS